MTDISTQNGELAMRQPPSARALMREMLAERRAFDRESLEYAWRSRAARKYYLICRRIPTTEWGNNNA